MTNFKLLITKKAWNIFCLAVIANVVIVSVYVYIFLQIKEKNQNIASLTDEIAVLSDRKKNLQSVKKIVSDTAVLHSQIDKYFIKKDGVVQFLNSIQALGVENNLSTKITSVAIGQMASTSEVMELLTADVQVAGVWTDVYKFASLLELMPIQLTVERVDYGKATGDSTVLDSKGKSKKAPPWSAVFAVKAIKLK